MTKVGKLRLYFRMLTALAFTLLIMDLMFSFLLTRELKHLRQLERVYLIRSVQCLKANR